jgi:hypothetical protein
VIKQAGQKIYWFKTEVYFHLRKKELVLWALGGLGNLLSRMKEVMLYKFGYWHKRCL